jgi:hypothetical protein
MTPTYDLIVTIGDSLTDLARQAAEWSDATFGTPAERGPIGPLKHLEKEAREAQESPQDPSEYADCLLLLLDAARRAGMTPLALIRAAQAKLLVNKTRTYHRPMANEPSEHVRGK